MTTPLPDVPDVIRRGLPCPTCHAVTADLDAHLAWHAEQADDRVALWRQIGPAR